MGKNNDNSKTVDLSQIAKNSKERRYVNAENIPDAYRPRSYSAPEKTNYSAMPISNDNYAPIPKLTDPKVPLNTEHYAAIPSNTTPNNYAAMPKSTPTVGHLNPIHNLGIYSAIPKLTQNDHYKPLPKTNPANDYGKLPLNSVIPEQKNPTDVDIPRPRNHSAPPAAVYGSISQVAAAANLQNAHVVVPPPNFKNYDASPFRNDGFAKNVAEIRQIEDGRATKYVSKALQNFDTFNLNVEDMRYLPNFQAKAEWTVTSFTNQLKDIEPQLKSLQSKLNNLKPYFEKLDLNKMDDQNIFLLAKNYHFNEYSNASELRPKIEMYRQLYLKHLTALEKVLPSLKQQYLKNILKIKNFCVDVRKAQLNQVTQSYSAWFMRLFSWIPFLNKIFQKDISHQKEQHSAIAKMMHSALKQMSLDASFKGIEVKVGEKTKTFANVQEEIQSALKFMEFEKAKTHVVEATIKPMQANVGLKLENVGLAFKPTVHGGYYLTHFQHENHRSPFIAKTQVPNNHQFLYTSQDNKTNLTRDDFLSEKLTTQQYHELIFLVDATFALLNARPKGDNTPVKISGQDARLTTMAFCVAEILGAKVTLDPNTNLALSKADIKIVEDNYKNINKIQRHLACLAQVEPVSIAKNDAVPSASL